MRKIISMLLLLSFFCISCSDDDPIVTTLSLDKEKLEFPAAGQALTLTVTTSANNYEVSIPASAAAWCSYTKEGKVITVTATENTTSAQRATTITVKVGNDEKTIPVTQSAGATTPGGNESAKFTIKGGTASSEETVSEQQGFALSFDGDLNTFWHTGWSTKDEFPFTATYEIEGADRLDYIVYYPRPDGGNGVFGEIEIHAKAEGSNDFVKVMDYNCERRTTASTIVLTQPVANPKEIRFIIKSGNGGHASCAEMEFYKGTQTPIEKGVQVPLGGNSFVVRGQANGVSDNGFINWSDPQTIYSSYFRVNKQSNLDLYLKYRSDADNKIDVRYNEQTFNVTLKKPTTRPDTIVQIGQIPNCPVGYVKLEFQGVELKGNVFAEPTDLYVDGIERSDMNFVDDFSFYWGRRGPSVHMGYQLPAGTTAEWFYNEITVPEGQDVVGSYYMTNGFSEGYCGIQVNTETERRVLFSVWNAEDQDNPSEVSPENRVVLVKQGQDVTVNDFGNEGSGGQSYLIFPWKAGTTYKLLTRIRPVEDNFSEYTAYFFAPETGQWRLIAVWKRPKIQTYNTGMHSFLENFSPTQGHLQRKVYFNNQWVYTTDGRWVELDQGKFTVDATGRPGWRMDYKGGADENGFFLQNCGFFNDYVQPDLMFTRTKTNTEPVIPWTELE